ncbi:MAG: DUF1492 domain-containing protein [Tannerellaceae bacterium]|nr:DUF1492 domain-containing protein [Tannerellaceae bacterium]
MTAKEYLSELYAMETMLECQRERYRECIDCATSTTIPINQVKVQSSKSDNGRIEKYMTMAADIEQDINQAESDYYNYKYKLMKLIQGMHNTHYMQILFKVYIQFKSVYQASKEMDLSYSYVVALHKKALKAFEDMYADKMIECEVQNRAAQ